MSQAQILADETSSSTRKKWWATGHRRALPGAALLRAIALRLGAGRCGADEPSPDVS